MSQQLTGSAEDIRVFVLTTTGAAIAESGTQRCKSIRHPDILKTRDPSGTPVREPLMHEIGLKIEVQRIESGGRRDRDRT
jgi:hypothetical protein